MGLLGPHSHPNLLLCFLQAPCRRQGNAGFGAEAFSSEGFELSSFQHLGPQGFTYVTLYSTELDSHRQCGALVIISCGLGPLGDIHLRVFMSGAFAGRAALVA